MSRLADALNERNKARAQYEEAKNELLNAVIEAVAVRGGAFAKDLAAEADLPACAVIGSIMSAEHNGILDGRKERARSVYVRLKEDGTINPNDTIVREYWAKKYSLSNNRRR